ncbi:MAG: aromatic hydrocarbon degradation protein [Proteobacteria bacterium]|nr:aromatic hydrocarbon degradation protein [Pseudomonadota bacterium]
MFDSRRFWIAIILCLAGGVLYADENHFKNVLVGDRAATMGGTYIAIADDSTGGYYNPAGLAYSVGDTISGSGNAYYTSKTRYKKTIGNQDWERDSETVLPNFFGITKSLGRTMLAFSYIVPDSFIEHQDQDYKFGSDVYFLSLHTEHQSNMSGPSIAYRFDDTWSLGASVFYGWGITRKLQNEYQKIGSDPIKNTFQSTKREESFLQSRIGVQSNFLEPLTIGLVYVETIPLALNVQKNISVVSSQTQTFSNSTEELPLKKPRQFSLGLAYFLSHDWLLAMDLDYLSSSTSGLNSVINYSFGGEWFLDAENAFRLGYFTNNDNRQEPGSNTVGPHEKIDMTGFTLGYSSYTRTSSFTLGTIYSSGKGKAQVYSGLADIRDLERTSLTLIFAANYNY